MAWTRTTTKIYPGVSKDAVWRLWADVNGWTRWHSDLDLCKLEGPFAAGSHFLLEPKGAPTFKIELTEVDEGRAFTDLTRFFGARMYDSLVAQNVAASAGAEGDAVVTLAREQRA